MTCILIFGDDKRASVNSSGHADPNLFWLTLLPENFSARFFLVQANEMIVYWFENTPLCHTLFSLACFQ